MKFSPHLTNFFVASYASLWPKLRLSIRYCAEASVATSVQRRRSLILPVASALVARALTEESRTARVLVGDSPSRKLQAYLLDW